MYYLEDNHNQRGRLFYDGTGAMPYRTVLEHTMDKYFILLLDSGAWYLSLVICWGSGGR